LGLNFLHTATTNVLAVRLLPFSQVRKRLKTTARRASARSSFLCCWSSLIAHLTRKKEKSKEDIYQRLPEHEIEKPQIASRLFSLVFLVSSCAVTFGVFLCFLLPHPKANSRRTRACAGCGQRKRNVKKKPKETKNTIHESWVSFVGFLFPCHISLPVHIQGSHKGYSRDFGCAKGKTISLQAR